MKANELRIGNLIDRQDYICKVTKIEEGGIIKNGWLSLGLRKLFGKTKTTLIDLN